MYISCIFHVCFSQQETGNKHILFGSQMLAGCCCFRSSLPPLQPEQPLDHRVCGPETQQSVEDRRLVLSTRSRKWAILAIFAYKVYAENYTRGWLKLEGMQLTLPQCVQCTADFQCEQELLFPVFAHDISWHFVNPRTGSLNIVGKPCEGRWWQPQIQRIRCDSDCASEPIPWQCVECDLKADSVRRCSQGFQQLMLNHTARSCQDETELSLSSFLR